MNLTYRIAVGIVVICFMAIGFLAGKPKTDDQQAAPATTQQQQPAAAQPAAPSNPEDAALKGFKIP